MKSRYVSSSSLLPFFLNPKWVFMSQEKVRSKKNLETSRKERGKASESAASCEGRE